MRLLDIGCGWGSLARYAAEHYGCEVVGLTVSQNQAKKARQLCQGLPIEILLQDYREFAKTCKRPFDAIVSVGMFEHVGSKNYRAYMEVAHRLLTDGGLQMVHTIGRDTSTRPGGDDPWILQYIFPNGQLPALAQIAAAAESLFVVEDVHNFGPYYDLTLMSWHKNFQQHWPSISKQGDQYDERFKRMWEYFLTSCAASFRQRRFQLWQVVFAKNPRAIYEPVR